jgi:fumarate hydratase class II
MGQSSNDVFPSAVHWPRSTRPRTACCRRWSALEKAFADKAEEFKDVVKAGRTHLMDAVPVTLGQEFAGYAAQIRLGARASQRAAQVAQIPLGGHGHRHRPQHPPRVRGARTQAAGEQSGLDIRAPRTRSRPRETATPSSSCRAR